MIRRCDLESEYNYFKNEILNVVENVFNSGEYVLGKNVKNFEKNFSKFIETKYSVGVANATQGLTIGLRILGVKNGDEVITSPFTAVPTLSSIMLAGAKPIFVDIDPETFLMDIDKIERKISKKTKAIMPVHIFGNVVDVNKIKRIVNDDIPIIEDASQAHGSKINKLQAGSLGDLSVFSFYPTKNLGCYGDGGIVSTNCRKLYNDLILTRNYGLQDKDTMLTVGENSRLDEIQAAILNIKLIELEKMNKKRVNVIDFYKKNLPQEIIFQKHDDNVEGNYHVAAARIEKHRDDLLHYLKVNKIQTNVYYTKPLFNQPAISYMDYNQNEFPECIKVCKEVFALPIYPEIPKTYLNTIEKTIWKFFN